MVYTIANGQLILSVDSLGAQMVSLKSEAGTEYLWSGDPSYWKGQAPNLFPFVGRLTNGEYIVYGKHYSMKNHGFASSSEFKLVRADSAAMEFSLSYDDKTMLQYPFRFEFRVKYALEENRVMVTFRVENLDEKIMPFGIGGHPGFRVPLEESDNFEDYYLEFSQVCAPDRVGHTPAVFLSGIDQRYPLEEGKILRLHHDLFDQDAIVLKNMSREVTLRSKSGRKSVTVSFPQMQYLGIWHMPKTDAPYLCIEPWTSLPSRQGVVETFECKSGLIHLLPGNVYKNAWSIMIKEEE